MEPRRPSLCHANIRKGDGAASAATTSRSSVTPRLERQDIRGYRRPGSHGGSSAPLPSLHSRTRHSMNILFALRPPSPPPIAPSPPSTHQPRAPAPPVDPGVYTRRRRVRGSEAADAATSWPCACATSSPSLGQTLANPWPAHGLARAFIWRFGGRSVGRFYVRWIS
jgi:hypothetical protein